MKQIIQILALVAIANTRVVTVPLIDKVALINDRMSVQEKYAQQLALSNGAIKSGIIGEEYRWPNGRIPFTADPAFTQIEYMEIKDAMRELENLTCIRFFEKSDDTPNWIDIKKGGEGDECKSEVGNQNHGGQDFILVADCLYKGMIMHELIHEIGFYHEQSRTDRDSYVIVNLDNVPPQYRFHFDKYNATQVDPQGMPYDYKSITHSSAYAFAIDPTIPTLIPTDPNIDLGDLGQRIALTDSDIIKINRLYEGICP